MKPRFPKNEFTDNWRAKNMATHALGRLTSKVLNTVTIITKKTNKK